MLDHISIPVADIARAAVFYDAVLATIGLRRRKERQAQSAMDPRREPHPYSGFSIGPAREARAPESDCT